MKRAQCEKISTSDDQFSGDHAQHCSLYAPFGFCRFCGTAAGPDYHLIGVAEPGENNVCCDNCWDPRLS